MGKGATTKTDVLQVVFLNSYDPAWRTNANLYVGLHTADPSLGDQTTSETAYSGYARAAVVKTAAGWTVAGASSQNAARITFPQCGAVAGPPLTHLTIGTVASPGAGQILYCGPLVAPLAIATLVTPVIEIGSLQAGEA